MGKGFLFFCCSCVILALTIVNLSIGPAVSGKLIDIGEDVPWGNLNCAKKRMIMIKQMMELYQMQLKNHMKSK